MRNSAFLPSDWQCLRLQIVLVPTIDRASVGSVSLTHFVGGPAAWTCRCWRANAGPPLLVLAIQRLRSQDAPMTQAVRTRLVDWLVCVALALVGGLFLFVGVLGPLGTNRETDRPAPLLVGGVLFAIGLWGLRSCVRNRHAEPLQPAQLAAAWNDPKRALLATILCSVAMYGAVLSAMLHPDSMPTSVKVFGERPLGMPLRLFVALFFTLLSVPIPVGAWHSYRILFRAASEGRCFFKQEIIMSLLRTPSSHPELRISRRIVIGVGAFYLALMFGWIAYAAARGI